MSLCDSWVELRQSIESHTHEVMEQFSCTYRAARTLVWTTYAHAAGGEEDNPFQELYIEFLQNLSEEELPLFICHTGVGLDMFEGRTESEAIDLFHEWLLEDDDNAIFGGYKITKDFEVFPVDEL